MTPPPAGDCEKRKGDAKEKENSEKRINTLGNMYEEKGQNISFLPRSTRGREFRIHLVLTPPFRFDHNLHFLTDFKRCLEVVAYGDEIEGRITEHLLNRHVV